MLSVTVPLDLIDAGDYSEAVSNMSKSMVAMARLHGGDFVCDTPAVTVYGVPAVQAPKVVIGPTKDQLRVWQSENPHVGVRLLSTSDYPPYFRDEIKTANDVLFLPGWRKGKQWDLTEQEVIYGVVRCEQHIEHCPGYAS